MENFTTINHRKKLLGGRTTEVAHRHEIIVTDASRNVYAGYVAERIDRQNMTVQANVVGSYDVNGSRITPMFLIVTENPADGGAGKIPKVKIE